MLDLSPELLAAIMQQDVAGIPAPGVPVLRGVASNVSANPINVVLSSAIPANETVVVLCAANGYRDLISLTESGTDHFAGTYASNGIVNTARISLAWHYSTTGFANGSTFVATMSNTSAKALFIYSIPNLDPSPSGAALAGSQASNAAPSVAADGSAVGRKQVIMSCIHVLVGHADAAIVHGGGFTKLDAVNISPTLRAETSFVFLNANQSVTKTDTLAVSRDYGTAVKGFRGLA